MWIVVTDLDGTLLNHDDYQWQAARPALDALTQHGIPVVFCTSKTRAEVEQLRRDTENSSPFITENGGAVYLPALDFPQCGESLPRVDGYLCIQLGTSYPTLVASLQEAAEAARCRVRGFAGASDEEVAAWCGFSVEEARVAKQREFDEPFLLLDGDGNALSQAIRDRGLHTTRGGRFWHILGDNDKGRAVAKLREAYAAEKGMAPRVVALGDSPNDIPMLQQADIAVCIPSPKLEEMMRVLPGALVATSGGASGWNETILQLLAKDLHTGSDHVSV